MDLVALRRVKRLRTLTSQNYNRSIAHDADRRPAPAPIYNCLYHRHQNPYGDVRVALGTSVAAIEAISDLEE
jgi:hypothetical protein